MAPKSYGSLREVLADMFPTYLKKCEDEGRCIHCGTAGGRIPAADKEQP